MLQCASIHFLLGHKVYPEAEGRIHDKSQGRAEVYPQGMAGFCVTELHLYSGGLHQTEPGDKTDKAEYKSLY